MKVRITLITENNRPVSALGENPEDTIRWGWDVFLSTLLSLADNKKNEDRFMIEDVQILDEDK